MKEWVLDVSVDTWHLTVRVHDLEDAYRKIKRYRDRYKDSEIFDVYLKTDGISLQLV